MVVPSHSLHTPAFFFLGRHAQSKLAARVTKKKVVELLGLDDELVVEYAMGLLEDESQPVKMPPSSLLPT